MKKLLILFSFLTILGSSLVATDAKAHGYYYRPAYAPAPFFSLSVGAPVYAPYYRRPYYAPRYYHPRPSCYQPYRHHYRGGHYGYRY